MKFLFVFILFLIPFSSQANTKPDFNAFGAWPVLHDGRVKTMESFARSNFFKITGETSLNDVDATQWLANTLFDPASSVSLPFIKIGRQDILELPAQGRPYYSMNDVMTAMNPHQDLISALESRDPAMLSASQKELLTVYEALSIYNQIIQSFSAVLPLQGQDKSYIDGGGVKAQRALILEGGRDNSLLKFMPSNNPSLPMVSLWSTIQSEIRTPDIQNIKAMATAWNDSDYQKWNELSVTVRDDLQSQNETSWTLPLEHYYVISNPMIWVMMLYILGSITIGFSKTKILSIPLIGTGFIIHVAALLSRSLILSRPPTGTLYETLLFGAAIVMLVGLCIRKNQLFLVTCALSTAFLLFISRGFIQGDSLNVLVAVLNTNFWLSTHVTCIIIGYSFCVISAMVGHVYLYTNSIKIEKLMVPLALGALLFTSVGTLLGGIWADQSWGRFWGWDPKENGALLIVLWLIWILHGRISGHFQKRGFACALGLTNIMVALTWFGVNLLGVGLHSYGFISGIALGLGSFVALQLIIITWLYFHHKKKIAHG